MRKSDVYIVRDAVSSASRFYDKPVSFETDGNDKEVLFVRVGDARIWVGGKSAYLVAGEALGELVRTSDGFMGSVCCKNIRDDLEFEKENRGGCS